MAQIPFSTLVCVSRFSSNLGSIDSCQKQMPITISFVCLFRRKKINCCVQYNQINLLPGSRHAAAVGLPPIPPDLRTSLSCLAGNPFRRAPRIHMLMYPIFRSSWLWITEHGLHTLVSWQSQYGREECVWWLDFFLLSPKTMFWGKRMVLPESAHHPYRRG